MVVFWGCLFFVVKRYAVREAKKWRSAVRNAKIERYAVRKGGCHPRVLGALTMGFQWALHWVIKKAINIMRSSQLNVLSYVGLFNL